MTDGEQECPKCHGHGYRAGCTECGLMDNEGMLIRLLKDDVVFLNSRRFVENDTGIEPPEEAEVSEDRTIVVFVICNDVFDWGSADADCVALKELKGLYDLHVDDPKDGAMKWSMKKRNMQPQPPLKKILKAHGRWETWMDELPLNHNDSGQKDDLLEVSE